jgi:hypothetical protein
VDEGITGFIVSDAAGMAEAVGMIPDIDRERCFLHAQSRFSAAAMADGYERVYRAIMEKGAGSEQKSRRLEPAGAAT